MKKSFAAVLVALVAVIAMVSLSLTCFATNLPTDPVDDKTTTAAPVTTTTAATTTTKAATTTAAATTTTTKATTAAPTEKDATTKEGQTFFVDPTTAAQGGNVNAVTDSIPQTGSGAGIAVFAAFAIAGAALAVVKSKKED